MGLLSPSIGGVLVLYALILVGNQYPLALPETILGLNAKSLWIVLLFTYAGIASLLPVWVLLQPRDYINGPQLFVGLGILYVAVLLSSPTLVAPMLNDTRLEPVGDALRRLLPDHLSGEIDRHLALSRDAPGMHEAALLERIAETVEHGLRDDDLLVFDTAPSGHTARLMALSEMMSAWTEGQLRRQQRAERFGDLVRNLCSDQGVGGRAPGGGPAGTPAARDQRIRQLLQRRRHRFTHLREVMGDAATTAFVIVLTAERLPVLEAMELHAQLVRAGVVVGGLVVHRRSQAVAGDVLMRRRAQEDAYLRMLRDSLPAIALQELPPQADEVHGTGAVAAFADRIAHDPG